jgi:hypothetical protein
MHKGSSEQLTPARSDEFPSRDSRTLVLRAGLLQQGGTTSFCLVKDLAPGGIRAKLYSSGFEAGRVMVRIADTQALPGRIAWLADGHAGIDFNEPLGSDAMRRLGRNPAAQRRRSVPRVTTAARAIVRSGGRSIAAELCDISSFGAKVRTKRELKADRPAVVDIPDLPSIRAYVRWTDGFESGLVFVTPLPMQVIGHWIDRRLRVSA